MSHTIHQKINGRGMDMAVDVRDIYGNQKIEDLLNLALDATSQEREKSSELEVGMIRRQGPGN